MIDKPKPLYADEFVHEYHVEWSAEKQEHVYEEWWLDIVIPEPPRDWKLTAIVSAPDHPGKLMTADDLRKLASKINAAAERLEEIEAGGPPLPPVNIPHKGRVS